MSRTQHLADAAVLLPVDLSWGTALTEEMVVCLSQRMSSGLFFEGLFAEEFSFIPSNERAIFESFQLL
jgi:hypothetical protein